MKNYKQLLELLEEYKKTKFWKEISGDDIFKLEEEKPVYISILGNAGNTMGIVVYNSEEELYSQFDISFGEYQNSPDAYLRLAAYEICIDDYGNLLIPEEAKKLKQHKIKSKHAVFKLLPGKLPRLVTEEEAKKLIKIIKKIICIANYWKENELPLSDTVNLDTMYSFKVENEKVSHQEIEYPPRPITNPKINKLDEDILNKLLLVSKQGSYDVALMYFPFPVGEGKNTIFPHLLLVQERSAQFIIGCELLKPEDLPNLQNKLLNIFHNIKLAPCELRFNSCDTQSYFKDLISELKIKTEVEPDLYPVFEAWLEMQRAANFDN